MRDRTKQTGRGGRPRKFDEGEALGKMQRQLWTTGLSGASLDGIARSAWHNRPSLAAAFGDKDAIYAQALTNPVCRNILAQSLHAIDALFLRRLKKEKRRLQASPVDLSALAAQLGATLHSLALRARAGWNRDRLQSLAAEMIGQVVAAVGSSNLSDGGR